RPRRGRTTLPSGPGSVERSSHEPNRRESAARVASFPRGRGSRLAWRLLPGATRRSGMGGHVKYRTRTLVVGLVVLAVIGGCARFRPMHPAPTAEGTKRVGEATMYPDAATPGATNPRVSQANIRTTICQTGWPAKVRPPRTYMTTLKEKQLAALGATVADPHEKCMPKSANPKCSEEDHLISPELGGAPRDPKNLWPQPVSRAQEKDCVEDYLHRQVCAGKITLQDAQQAIVADWYAVYVKHHASKRPSVAGRSASPTA